jgi:hypothetical protein
MKLNPVNKPKGHNRYCGPAVISAVTGCTTNEAAWIIRTIGYHKSVRGSSTRDVRASLRQYGISCDQMPKGAGWGDPAPTLTQWLRINKEIRTAGRVYLLVAGNHWQLVSGRKYVCGVTGDIVSIKDKKVKRRARVTEVYELKAAGKIQLSPEFAAKWDYYLREKQASVKRSSSLAGHKRRAAALGLCWDYESDTKNHWIYPGPSWIDDPREDEHYAYDADMFGDLVDYYEQHESEYRREAA